MADVGRLPEGREEIAEVLLVDLLQRERHAEVRDVVLLGHRSGGRVQIGAEAAEIADHALGGQRLHAGHRLGRVGLVVQQDQLDRHLHAAHRDAAARVEALDRELVARADLGATRAVAAGERDHRAHLDRLSPRVGGG